ncbi:transcriptional regulator of fatty acids degradation (FadR-long-chain (C14-C20) acyl-CoAs) [anaerobic digester metagenome]|jgi:AcrR family transcriptional regulator|uniref:Transcriptional regulator of fatty acids degradation (FadR-long-chain (C14-C20) acyl-CoAs) n=1 Tax=anaerobic digester metagenome TaxID=1263854 RepID=A0A485M863_9ZZZZ
MRSPDKNPLECISLEMRNEDPEREVIFTLSLLAAGNGIFYNRTDWSVQKLGGIFMGDTFSEAFKGNRGDSRALFEAAAGIFARKGYHKATVEEIARAIGVAKGTIYYHFENKEDLYLAVIREGVYLFKQKLDRVAATKAPPPEKIGMLIEGQLLFFEQEKDFVFLFLKELFSTGVRRELLAEMLAGCLQVIRNVVEDGIQDGSFKAVDPEITTSALFGMVAIPALHYLSYNRNIPLEPVHSAVGEILFKGICASRV